MTARITLIGSWREMLKATDPDEFQRRIVREVQMAHARIGRRFVADARGLIRAGVYEPNSPITIILKGSSKPLVDRGTLFQGITFDQPDPFLLRVGVLRTKVGEKVINIGAILHEGATVDLQQHPQVRAKLWSMLRSALGAADQLKGKRRGAVRSAAQQLGIDRMGPTARGRQLRFMYATGKITRPAPVASPGGGAPGKIVIPPRPFIITPLHAPAFVAFVHDEYEQAARRALGLG